MILSKSHWKKINICKSFLWKIKFKKEKFDLSLMTRGIRIVFLDMIGEIGIYSKTNIYFRDAALYVFCFTKLS